MSASAALDASREDAAPPADGGRPKVRVVLAALAAAVVAAVVLVPLGTAAYVVAVSGRDDLAPSQVLVVLGASQFDGDPSPVLANRLDRAADLYRSGVAPHIVTVGGKRPGDRFTEAEAGRRYLLAHGIPSSAVTAVLTGSDTVESLQAVARVMVERGWSTASLVTDPVHEARSLAIARHAGITARTTPTRSGPGSSLTPDSVVRETAGLLWFWILGRFEVPRVLP